MKKHCYEIIINQPLKKRTEVVYDYSATRGKGIKLHRIFDDTYVEATFGERFKLLANPTKQGERI